VGKGAFVRDCRGAERMGVICSVGIVDNSVTGKYKGDRDSGVKDRERRRGEGGEMETEWKKKIVGRKKRNCDNRGKQIDIWTERKREVANNGL
jgi:hypothetical protein